MAYTVKELVLGVHGAEKTTGTGSGTLYSLPLLSNDSTVNLRFVVAEAAPSTDDGLAEGSLWLDITTGSIKFYIKTDSTTWAVVGTQS